MSSSATIATLPVRESILADPSGQIMRTVTRRFAGLVGAGATPVLIAPANPTRMALFVQAETLDPVFVSPFPSAPAVLPLAGADTRVPVLIHAAAYPGLVQGEWWAVTTLGATLMVYETYVQG